jgi:3-hydroxyacyl-CoA dehydrogenase
MDVRTVAVVGAGIMGAGIAQALAMHGYRVQLHDLTEDRLANALDRIENHRFGLRRAVERGKLPTEELDGVLDRIATTTDLAAACAGIDLAIEAVPEDLALKMQVFRSMDESAPRHAILTSNAAGLSITALAWATTRPELVLGWHWSQPASIMRLAELVIHPDTSPDAIATVSEVARACGKNPIAVNDQPETWGFVVNRINAAVRREARQIVDEGVASEEQVDQLMKDCFRWPMGPFEMLKGEGFN